MTISATYAILDHLDTLAEQEPLLPFDRLVAHDLARPFASQPTAIFVAATRLLEGLWLNYLGAWCPDEVERIVWKGEPISDTEDAPLGYQLMLAGIALRNEGCRLASAAASPRHLAQIRSALPAHSAPWERDWWDAAITWMEILHAQWASEQDWYGQPLPTTIARLSAAFYRNNPALHQGNTSIVTPITVARQAFMLKQRIEPGPLLTLFDGFQRECAMLAVLRTFPWPLGPRIGCLYMADDGMLTLITTKLAGKIMHDLRRAASQVSLASVQAAVLAEFVGNCPDRHFENLFVDRLHAQPWIFDFAPALDDDAGVIAPLLLPDANAAHEQQCEEFTRALWRWHPDCLVTAGGELLILEDVLLGVCQAREAALHALTPFGLTPAMHATLDRRFAVLQRLAESPGEHTLEALNRLIAA